MVVFFRTTSFRGRTPFVVVVGRVAPFREDQRAFQRRRRRRLYIYIGDGFVKSGCCSFRVWGLGFKALKKSLGLKSG